MKFKINISTLGRLVAVLFFIAVFYTLALFPAKAQFQDFDFSGNSEDSYQCFNRAGELQENATITKGQDGYFYCSGYDWADGAENVKIRAVLKPPKLQQLEVWFVRVLYVIWALVATASFFYLVVLGYQYMITRGDVTKITAIRQKIINYMVGFALVFLAVPIITTIFNLLGINENVQCYQLNNMPGFQFFYTDLCTDPTNQIGIDDPCTSPDAAGFPCTIGAASRECNVGANRCIIYECPAATGIWTVSGTFDCRN